MRPTEVLDSFHEECGVVGIIGDKEAANLTYLALYALQHRGQEACGIVSLQKQADGQFIVHEQKAFGRVADNFGRDELLTLLGNQAIGHVRYSTQGGRSLQNIQPFVFSTPSIGVVSVAHNGNLTNAKGLRRELEEAGSIFTTTSDSEIFMHLLAKSRRASLRDRIADVMSQVKGAYSLVIQAPDRLYGVRDPYGFRPLVLGRKEEAWIIASETCALDLIGASYEREIKPGEIVCIKDKNLETWHPFGRLPKPASCSFEPIYFSRPDSRVPNGSIYELRKRMGQVLAEEAPADADLVIPIPDSGTPLALGYAQAARLPFEMGLVRNHYIGRTFIEPTQAIRDFGVKIKLNPVISNIMNKKIVIVDDSLVRGTTSTKIVRMLRNAGAKEIHFRVGSPPITHSCFYGVSTPDRSRLLAAQKTTAEICELLEADSLAYLSVEGLQKALSITNMSYCFACFNGSYPEEIYELIPGQPTDGLEQKLIAKVDKLKLKK